MPIEHAIPRIVAARLIRYLGENYVFSARVNRQWTAEARVGNVVRILPPGAVEVDDYDPEGNNPIEYRRYAPGAGIDITLDQIKSWSITVEDVYERQSVPMVLSSGVEIAGRELMQVMDEYVRDAMHGATTLSREISGTGAKVNFANPLSDGDQHRIKSAFRAAVRRMDDVNIPRMGRWAICGPVMISCLTEMFEQGNLADGMMQDTARNGFSGSLYGLSIYATSNPLKHDDGATHEFEKVLFGNDYGYALIKQMDNTERIRLQTRYADAVRGLCVYGGKFIEAAGFFDGQMFYENLPDFS